MKNILYLLLTFLILISCEDSNQVNYYVPDSVNDISVDAQGNIWFGTSNFGIVFYNGSKWKNYRTSNSGLPGNWIGSIDFNSKGNMWANSISSIVFFDGKNMLTIDSITTAEIVCLAVDNSNNVWLGTNGTGLLKFDGNNWFQYIIHDTTLFSYIKNIYIDHNDVVWAVSLFGIYKIDGNLRLMYTENDHKMPDNSITDVLLDKDGNFWAVGTKGIAYRPTDGAWTTLDSASKALPVSNFRSVCVDSNNVKWFATFGGGIASYDGNSWKFYNQQNSGIYSNYNKSIAADKKGTVWIGSFGRYVSKFDGISWKNIDIYDF